MARSIENSSNVQVKYLVSAGVFEDVAEQVVRQFWRQRPFASLLTNEHYLQLVGQYLLADNITDFKIIDFYRHYSENIVEPEYLADLEKFAFCLELIQVTEVNFIEADKIIPSSKLERLIDKGYLNVTSSMISFHHASIHSYFSASYLNKYLDTVSFLDSLIKKKKAKLTIPANWHEVLAFSVQIPNGESVAMWIYDNLSKSPLLFEESLLDSLGQSNIGSLLNSKQRRAFFKQIFSLYEMRMVWLPDGAERLLASIATSHDIELLKNRLNATYDDNQRELITKSNVIAIIDEVLRTNVGVIETDLVYWHELLIENANDLNSNGVLQRRALKALAYFKEPKDIDRLTIASKHPDRLVNEAFLIFCYEVAPNLKQTISYLAQGMLKGTEIFARYGLYSISTSAGINNFLKIFASNKSYLQKFLDGESIFNKGDRSDDDKILDVIRNNFNSQTIKNSKNFVIQAYSIDFGYYAERSYFIRSLIDLILIAKPKFAYEIINEIQTIEGLAKFSDLYSKVVTLDNYLEIFNDLSSKFDVESAKRFLYLLSSDDRQKILEDAATRGLIEPIKIEKSIDHEASRNGKIIEEFNFALMPEDGKYDPKIFEKYIQNKSLLDNRLSPAQKGRLLSLAKDEVLERFDPFDIQVKVTKQNEEAGSKSFSITSYASYYGDAIKVVESFIGKEETLLHYRNQIVHFLPFAFDDDAEYILNLVAPLSDAELNEINLYFQNKKREVRYYRSYSYIAILEQTIASNGNAASAIPTLKSFIDDEKLSVYERESALKVYGQVIDYSSLIDKRYLNLIFNRNINSEKSIILSEKANEILITVYQDRRSIKWRFEQIISRAEPFISGTGVHTVGPLEHELYSKDFAKPLLSLDKSYVNKFINLMDLSIQLIESDTKQYSNYSNYLWSLTTDYFLHIANERDPSPLHKLEKWYVKIKKSNGANWFESYLENIRKKFSQELSKMSLDDAVAYLEVHSNAK